VNRIKFVTSNRAKAVHSAAILSQCGIQLSWLAADDIPELQAENSTEVVLAKATAAWDRYGDDVPLLVADSSFHIDALNGWPGANVKWATRDLGVEGYLRLMKPWPRPDQRSCQFVDSMACVYGPASHQRRVFVRKVAGCLSTTAAEKIESSGPRYSQLWRIFILAGYSVTIAEMDDPTLRAFRSRPGIATAYHELAAWLKSLPPN
jgi:inosine/xanthosine triphosphate pyrophosphatase family protein